MKYKAFLPALFILIGFPGLFAQSIVADTTKGCDSLIVKFRLEPGVSSGTTLSWNFEGGIPMNGDVVAPLVLFRNPGAYTISCRINNSSTITSPDLIKVFKSPSSHFIFRDTLDIGEYAYFFRHIVHDADISPYTLTWQFTDGGVANTESFVHEFPGTGEYYARLIAQSVNGCSDTTRQRIAVVNLLKVPNVFTPNDDAINDVFVVRTDGVHNYIFSVYTRSGTLVYRSESPDISWDGRSFAGTYITAGVYYYTIKQKEQEISTADITGIVYLIR